MIRSTAAIEETLRRALDSTKHWMERFPELAKAALNGRAMTQEMIRLSYVDGYLRIKHTTPLILRAIARLDSLRRRHEAQFWIAHLSEEAAHDKIMRRDLSNLLGGSKRASAILRKSRITPASAALLGYFDWQIAHGNPGLLIALRLFLEAYIADIEDWRIAEVDSLVDHRSQILHTHKDLDVDHLAECMSYISRSCRGCISDVDWSIEFVGRCLTEAHASLAQQILRHNT